ncbi:MAG: DUF72 domain-containing protein [Rubripirellula sp.]
MNAHSPDLPIFLGCPVWSCGHWGGEVYPEKTRRTEWLSWYSRTFNTVEGNSTFYALPRPEALQRWVEQTASGFKFSLKFPRLISHELELSNAEAVTKDFIRCLEPLANADRLGPTFLQLGPRFGPDRFPLLCRFLDQLPSDFRWAVELRHMDWFDSGEHEKRINDFLMDRRIDKVLFDSRPLFQSPPDDAIETESQRRKPKTPIRQTVTGKHPMLRIVGRNRIEMTDRFFSQWAPIVAGWIRDGLEPYVFTHAPDDQFAPALARRLASRMQCETPELKWNIPSPPQAARQLSLLADP